MLILKDFSFFCFFNFGYKKWKKTQNLCTNCWNVGSQNEQINEECKTWITGYFLVLLTSCEQSVAWKKFNKLMPVFYAIYLQ